MFIFSFISLIYLFFIIRIERCEFKCIISIMVFVYWGIGVSRFLIVLISLFRVVVICLSSVVIGIMFRIIEVE